MKMHFTCTGFHPVQQLVPVRRMDLKLVLEAVFVER